jgi:tubulin-like protein CetZ
MTRLFARRVMKVTVIGFGQCGGRIADEFSRINRDAIMKRGIEITPGIYAVNTDSADLAGLRRIKADSKHRILIGGQKTGGHGVGKINELAAAVTKEEADKILDAIAGTKRLYETDAFLLAASGSGGTGSGAISVMTKMIKEHYSDKPVYDMIVLPFQHEEETEERSTFNTAACLKSIDGVADAVFIYDNQRFGRKDGNQSIDFINMNREIVDPFFDLLCSGEETKSKYIGSKTLDTGDIKQTLTGWTCVGFGRVEVPVFNFPFGRSSYRTENSQTSKGLQAMKQALDNLSFGFNTENAARVTFLVSGPRGEMNINIIKEIGIHLRKIAPEATIRNGDYPREKDVIDVHIIFSGLSHVDKIRDYYIKSSKLIAEYKRRRENREKDHREMGDLGKDIPLLS